MQAIGVSALCAVIVVGINVAIDLYGLFRPLDNRKIVVHNSERISKYLLAYRYIPEQFNTVLVGTSLSANLDVAPYADTTEFRIYNASVTGVNLTELQPIVEKTIEGGMKQVVVCISPYMVETSGSKEVDLNRKIYYGAYGSMDLYQTYFVGIIRHMDLMPRKFPKGQINEFGVNDYSPLFKVRDVAASIDEQVEKHRNTKLKVDTIAVRELKYVFNLMEKNNVKYIAYFHPYPAKIYDNSLANQLEFRKLIKTIIPDTTRIVDFNTPEQRPFTSDLSNYMDHGHLNDKGQKTVMNWLYLKMKEMF
jgi:hypothetical protein